MEVIFEGMENSRNKIEPDGRSWNIRSEDVSLEGLELRTMIKMDGFSPDVILYPYGISSFSTFSSSFFFRQIPEKKGEINKKKMIAKKTAEMGRLKKMRGSS